MVCCIVRALWEDCSVLEGWGATHRFARMHEVRMAKHTLGTTVHTACGTRRPIGAITPSGRPQHVCWRGHVHVTTVSFRVVSRSSVRWELPPSVFGASSISHTRQAAQHLAFQRISSFGQCCDIHDGGHDAPRCVRNGSVNRFLKFISISESLDQHYTSQSAAECGR